MPTVRFASAADVAAIQSVARQTWARTYAGLIPEQVQSRLLGSWYSGISLERAIASENSWFIVSELNSEIVGFAQFVLRSDGLGELTRIYVLPKHQGKGIGMQLLKSGVQALKERGVRDLRVVVERDNQIGRRFYESRGFAWLRDLENEIRDEPTGIFKLACSEYSLKI